MKTIICIVVLLGFTGMFTKTNAQEYTSSPPPQDNRVYNDNDVSRPSGYFELSLGWAQPIGSFMNASGSGYNGYALPGENINLSLGVPVNHSNIGIAFMVGSCYNTFDINTYVSNIAASDANNNYKPLIQDGYNESFIMGGLYATLPVYRLSIDFRVLGGIAFCYLPEVDYEAYHYDALAAGYDNYEWDTYSSRANSFAFGMGADLRYRVRRFSLMFGVDMISTTPMVNTEQQYTDPNGNYSYSHVGGYMTISIISASIGLAYEIR
jgi:hypothetical protein